MATAAPITDTAAAVWERVVQLEGGLSPATARALLKLNFSPQDQQRMDQLSGAARAGTLNTLEQAEIDTYEHLACLLDILHSQARRTLKRRRIAS